MTTYQDWHSSIAPALVLSPTLPHQPPSEAHKLAKEWRAGWRNEFHPRLQAKEIVELIGESWVNYTLKKSI